MDDRLVTMQVSEKRMTFGAVLTGGVVVGYCGSGALPITWGCILPRSRLLCTCVRRQQLEIV